MKLTPLRLEVLRAVSDGKLVQVCMGISVATYMLDGRNVSRQCRWLWGQGLIELKSGVIGPRVPWVPTRKGGVAVLREGPWA